MQSLDLLIAPEPMSKE